MVAPTLSGSAGTVNVCFNPGQTKPHYRSFPIIHTASTEDTHTHTTPHQRKEGRKKESGEQALPVFPAGQTNNTPLYHSGETLLYGM